MKKLILYFPIIICLTGCDWIFGNGEPFPPEPDIEHITIIENNSSHYIRIERFYDGELRYSITPGINKKFEFYNQIFEGQLPYFPAIADSAHVVYDDSVAVWHTKEDVQVVSRSLLLPSSYTGGKVNDKLYEIYYSFTDADYEEAMVLNGGG